MTVFYVGEVPFMKLRKIVEKHTPGATLQYTLGLWKGIWAVGTKIEVSPCSRDVENSIISDIKEQLNQEAVGVVRLPDMEFL